MPYRSSKNSMLQQILDKTNLFEECVPGKPVVELLGDHRVLIENHRGIVAYHHECIGVRVCYGDIYVNGRNLRLRHMTGGKLLIVGVIETIEVKRA